MASLSGTGPIDGIQVDNGSASLLLDRRHVSLDGLRIGATEYRDGIPGGPQRGERPHTQQR
jgi:hypothetical protein